MKTAGTNGPDPIDLHVGLQLRSRRMRADMTQSDLGRSLGITFQQVQKYEKGTNRVSASMLARAADAIGCGIADFFPAPGTLANADEPNIGSVKGGHEMARIYSTLPPSQRDLLLNLARELARSRRAGLHPATDGASDLSATD